MRQIFEARAKETILAYLKGLREGTPEEQVWPLCGKQHQVGIK